MWQWDLMKNSGYKVEKHLVEDDYNTLVVAMKEK